MGFARRAMPAPSLFVQIVPTSLLSFQVVWVSLCQKGASSSQCFTLMFSP